MDQTLHRGAGHFLEEATLTSVLFFDASHTSHTRAQTGIQRVTRSLFAELTKTQAVKAVCHDPYLDAWRPLDAGELDHLVPGQISGGSRGARWTLPKRLAGHARRLVGARPELPAADALVCPELFSAKTGARLPEIFARVRGPRVAIFHDAIGLKLPELSPPATVARLPAYLQELLLFDGVAAVSEDSATSLRDYWQWLGITAAPPVKAVPHGVAPLPKEAEDFPAPKTPRILCVGTIEGRKNHLALLDACEALWLEGLSFELQLLGLARVDTAGPALAKIVELRRNGRPLIFDGAAADAKLQAAYRQCSFTVYPSMIEGFGLPVIESLQHGRPCVCSGRGALAESARGGGCVVLDQVDATSLAGAIRRLLRSPGELAALAAEARARRFKSWTDCARELTGWMQSLPRRT